MQLEARIPHPAFEVHTRMGKCCLESQQKEAFIANGAIIYPLFPPYMTPECKVIHYSLDKFIGMLTKESTIRNVSALLT